MTKHQGLEKMKLTALHPTNLHTEADAAGAAEALKLARTESYLLISSSEH